LFFLKFCFFYYNFLLKNKKFFFLRKILGNIFIFNQYFFHNKNTVCLFISVGRKKKINTEKKKSFLYVERI